MDFNPEKPIYLQIGDWMTDKILSGDWPEEGRIPSVRDLAVLLQVNPNTAMRAFDELQDEQIIFNRRGIGFFVSPGAHERILHRQRTEFVRETLPALFDRMQLLGVDAETLMNEYEKHKNREKMKTSTKIFIGYGAAVALLMIVCLCISAGRYHRSKPAVEKLLAQFASTRINHVVVTEEGSGRRLTLEEGNVWLNKPAEEWDEPKSGNRLVLANRLDDVRISGDTLYVTAPAGGKPWPIRLDLPDLNAAKEE